MGLKFASPEISSTRDVSAKREIADFGKKKIRSPRPGNGVDTVFGGFDGSDSQFQRKRAKLSRGDAEGKRRQKALFTQFRIFRQIYPRPISPVTFPKPEEIANEVFFPGPIFETENILPRPSPASLYIIPGSFILRDFFRLHFSFFLS